MTALIASLVVIQTSLHGADQSKWESLRPMLEEHCYDCHGGIKTKGGVDLKKLDKNPSVLSEYALWDKVKEVVADGEMPPKKEEALKPDEKNKLLSWVTQELDQAANINVGDPGPVTMRRLTNAEYDYTMRDLTGQDYGLAKEFPADSGGGEGFSNTGDVLFVSPAQLDKYLTAARKIADNASIMPGTGIRFQSIRVGARGPEQIKAQAEQALYVWYQKKAEPILPKDDEDLREGDYMLACWKWKHKELTGATSLAQLAKDLKLTQGFLENWWTMLNSEQPKSRFLDLTRVPWRELPGPDAANPKAVPAFVEAKLKQLDAERKIWYFKDPKKPGSGHVQRSQQDADGIRPYDINASVKGEKVVHLCIGDDGDGNKGDIAMVTKLQVQVGKETIPYTNYLRKRITEDKAAIEKLKAAPPVGAVPNAKEVKPTLTLEQLNQRITEAETVLAKFGKHPLGKPVDADTIVISAPKVETFPLPEGAHHFKATCKLDIDTPDADFATIQWQLVTGTPPDVTKIIPGVLTLWKAKSKADFATMQDFEKMRKTFPDEYVRRLEEVARNQYSQKPGPGVYYYSDEQLAAVLSDAEKNELKKMKTDWGYTALGAKLPKQQGDEFDRMMCEHLRYFASMAWRRPLQGEENAKLDALYADGRAKELDREQAAREVIVRILVSPNFLFKAETIPALASTPAGNSNRDVALNVWELASRLSFFLWSSKPDQELWKVAADGSLLKPEILSAQVKRMMKDPKAESMAREFMGQWLAFDGFASHSGVDEKKFPQFTSDLRRDLYKETVTFFTHLIRDDRPVTDIVTGDYTYLNERLAKHYDIPDVHGDEFQQINVSKFHRGGLLGMGSVLTKTSRPERTSPVLRGNWLLQTVLGFSAPPPPPNVPKLKEGAQRPTTMRATLEQHRADRACSVCHDRIDPLGFALEGFDPIGRYRSNDDTGTQIDDSAQIKDGPKFNGLDGLRTYLKTRDGQFTGHFCRKVLGYALGRQVLPTDKALITKMQAEMKANGNKVSAALLTLVNSRQFLNRRNDPPVASNP